MTDRLTHETAYRGAKTMARLANTRIVVCGAGAIGSHLAMTLARMGAKTLYVVDFDRVEDKNLQSQIYNTADVGSLKCHALRNRIFAAVGVEIETEAKKLDETNVKKMLRGAGVVVCAFDNAKSRGIVHDHCTRLCTPEIQVGLSGDDHSFGSVIFGHAYKVPPDSDETPPCDYPLSLPLVMMTVAVAAEAVVHAIASLPARETLIGGWHITGKDFAVGQF